MRKSEIQTGVEYYAARMGGVVLEHRAMRILVWPGPQIPNNKVNCAYLDFQGEWKPIVLSLVQIRPMSDTLAERVENIHRRQRESVAARERQAAQEQAFYDQFKARYGFELDRSDFQWLDFNDDGTAYFDMTESLLYRIIERASQHMMRPGDHARV